MLNIARKTSIRKALFGLSFFARERKPLFIAVVSLVAVGSIFGILSLRMLAAFNEQINYQGKLSNVDGTPVDDGNYDMVFSICTDLAGTTCPWTGNYTVANGNPVVLKRGLFSVMLGSGAGNAFDPAFNWNQDLYLKVNIGGTDLSPLKRLAAVPAAFESSKLQGGTWLKPGRVGGATADGADAVPNTGRFTTLETTSTGGNQFVLSGAVSQINFTGATSSEIATSGTNLYIRPAGHLYLEPGGGSAIIANANSTGSAMDVSQTNANGYGLFVMIKDGSGSGHEAFKVSTGVGGTGGDANALIVNAAGYVGVGISLPTNKLSVADNTSGQFATLITQNHVSGNGIRVLTGGSTSGVESFRIESGSNTTFLVTGAGNVGISPANPLSLGDRLDIGGGGIRLSNNSASTALASKTAYYANGNSGASGLIIGMSSSADTKYPVSAGVIHNGLANSPIVFGTANTTNDQWNERMRITSLGNIGIGTETAVTPASLLTLTSSSGGGAATRYYYTNPTQYPNYYGTIVHNGASVAPYGLVVTSLGDTASPNAGYMTFRTGLTDGAGVQALATRMVINESGNVGIGASPTGTSAMFSVYTSNNRPTYKFVYDRGAFTNAATINPDPIEEKQFDVELTNGSSVDITDNVIGDANSKWRVVFQGQWGNTLAGTDLVQVAPYLELSNESGYNHDFYMEKQNGGIVGEVYVSRNASTGKLQVHVQNITAGYYITFMGKITTYSGYFGAGNSAAASRNAMMLRGNLDVQRTTFAAGYEELVGINLRNGDTKTGSGTKLDFWSSTGVSPYYPGNKVAGVRYYNNSSASYGSPHLWVGTDSGGGGLALGVNGSIGMFMKTDGKVGVGTTNPQYLLEVAGDINVTASGVYRASGVTGKTPSGSFTFSTTSPSGSCTLTFSQGILTDAAGTCAP